MRHLRSRSAFLVWSFGLLVVLGPFIAEHQSLVDQLVSRVLIAIVLASGVYAVSRRRAHLNVALGLMAVNILFSVVMAVHPTHGVIVVNLLAGAAFYFTLCFLLMQHILTSRVVTADIIYNSIAGYFLLAAGFAVLYLLSAEFDPAAIEGRLHRHFPLPFSIMDAVYFSTATLTSVGYGDILPCSPMARSLASLEMLIGALYPAVLISRLVGIYASLPPAED